MKSFTLAVLVFLFPLYLLAQPMSNDDKRKFDFAKDKYQEGAYTAAIKYCTELINDPLISRKSDVYKLRALCYRAVGDYTKAVFDYSEVIQSNRKDYGLYVELAQVYTCQKDFEKADEKLMEAGRLFREQQQGRVNNFLEEEAGRVKLYLGNYREAIDYFRRAIDNHSMMAYIDLLSAYFRMNDMSSVKAFSDSLLNGPNYAPLLSDSSLYYYVWALNSIAKNPANARITTGISKIYQYYKTNDNRCFKAFHNDVVAMEAYVHSALGNDSMAYVLYKKANAVNQRQFDIKDKIVTLKAKLNIDQTPPLILVKNPIIDENQTVTMANTTRYEMYGQVTDSSGIEAVIINSVPITAKLEDDGIFVYSLELQTGLNEIEITAIDKNENVSTKKFIINNAQSGSAIPGSDDLDNIKELETSIAYHAILIAENDYQDQAFADLKKPVQNVSELKQILVRDYMFDEKNVMVITNGTRMDILDSLEKKTSSLKETDNLLIYYAGHGTIRKAGSEIIGGYIIPADAKQGKWTSYISSNDLKEPLKQTEAKHVLVVVDACFGGALLRSTIDMAPPGIRKSFAHTSRRILSSGNLEEVPDDSKFFENLKLYLTSNTARYSTSLDLYSTIKKNSENNIPQYDRIKDLNDSGGEFVFIKTSIPLK